MAMQQRCRRLIVENPYRGPVSTENCPDATEHAMKVCNQDGFTLSLYIYEHHFRSFILLYICNRLHWYRYRVVDLHCYEGLLTLHSWWLPKVAYGSDNFGATPSYRKLYRRLYGKPSSYTVPCIYNVSTVMWPFRCLDPAWARSRYDWMQLK